MKTYLSGFDSLFAKAQLKGVQYAPVIKALNNAQLPFSALLSLKDIEKEEDRKNILAEVKATGKNAKTVYEGIKAFYEEHKQIELTHAALRDALDESILGLYKVTFRGFDLQYSFPKEHILLRQEEVEIVKGQKEPLVNWFYEVVKRTGAIPAKPKDSPLLKGFDWAKIVTRNEGSRLVLVLGKIREGRISHDGAIKVEAK